MKIKTKYLKLTNDMLGEDTFLLVEAEDYNSYDPQLGKSTGIREGTRFTVLIDNPQKEINCEKLEVKIVGENPIPQYKNGERIDCKFINLQLTISNIEYGKADIKGTADGIKLMSSKGQAEQQIDGQIKLKM